MMYSVAYNIKATHRQNCCLYGKKALSGTPVKISQLRQFRIFGETVKNKNRLTFSIVKPTLTKYKYKYKTGSTGFPYRFYIFHQ
jgi:hypothetical protein